MPIRSTSDRYGAIAITLHWLTALLIVVLFVVGLLAAGQADSAAKLALLRFHVPLGVAVLVLTVLRILWWWVGDKRPAPPEGQPAWQHWTAVIVHAGLYLVIVALAASGIATLVLSGALPAIVAGTSLPDLETLAPRIAHGLFSKLLLALLALHVGAALYHQLVLRDRLLARMGLGRT